MVTKDQILDYLDIKVFLRSLPVLNKTIELTYHNCTEEDIELWWDFDNNEKMQR